MSSNLEKFQLINENRLASHRYFQSLLELAYQKALLSDAEIERIQYECLNLLAYKTEQFNAGESSSIRTEKAEELMASILFTIGLWLKTYKTPDNALEALKTESIKDIYQKGRDRIDTRVAAAKAVHAKLLKNLVNTPNVFYSSTIDGGIKGFFKLYYPTFTAQEIHITADYPTFNHMPKLDGIEFIQAYLNCLYHENLFCSNFLAEDIHHLLCGYEKDYKNNLLNIYEPVLLAALGCSIAKSDIKSLNITKQGAEYVCKTLAAISQGEMSMVLKSALEDVIGVLNCPPGLAKYLQASLPAITLRVQTAAGLGTLNRVFALPAFPENDPRYLISFGEKMPDKNYRKIVEEIKNCRFTSDKISIIQTQIHSLADLADVLLDAELTSTELNMILKDLALPQFAALYQRHVYTVGSALSDLREEEILLQKAIAEIFAEMPKNHQTIVLKISETQEDE